MPDNLAVRSVLAAMWLGSFFLLIRWGSDFFESSMPVPEITPEMTAARRQEIGRWLVGKVSPEQARHQILGGGAIEDWHQDQHQIASELDTWLAAADCELWEYDSGPESWDQLGGECGYAHVRNGEVTDFWLHLMN